MPCQHAALLAADSNRSSGLGDTYMDDDVTFACRACYIRAKVTTLLTYSDRFDATEAIEDVTGGVKPIAETVNRNVARFIESSFQTMGNTVMQDVQDVVAGNFGIEMLPYPTLPFDFNLGIASLENITVQSWIDGMDVYVQLETSPSKGATYTINLFKSQPRVTLKVSNSLILDLSVSMDLIIDSISAMNMTNGFHVMLNDGFLMESKLFATTPPRVTS